jgi:uncharacterized membrane protein YdjX (TVP38/TMEM64 family)
MAALPALLVILIVLAAGYALGLHSYPALEQLSGSRKALESFTGDHFALALAVYMLAYAAAVAVMFPAPWVLTVAGGFVFGAVVGGATAVLAATAGATVLFWAARTAFGDFLRRRVSGAAAKLANGFEKDAFGYLLGLRLVPIIPFVVLNIVPAMLKVGFRTFVLATLLGSLPGTLVFAYVGQSLDGVVLATERTGRQLTAQDLITPELTIALAALGALALVSVVVRRLRAAT